MKYTIEYDSELKQFYICDNSNPNIKKYNSKVMGAILFSNVKEICEEELIKIVEEEKYEQLSLF